MQDKNKEYILISDFARIAGVSTQSIYKRVDRDLAEYCVVSGGKRKISTEALKLFEKPNIKKYDLGSDNTFELLKAVTERLENHINALEKQLEIKDKQIAELSKALEHEQQLAQQSHMLHAGTIKSFPEDIKKKGFFYRLFHGSD